MAADQWSIMLAGKPDDDRFVLAFEDLTAGRGQGFGSKSDPMSEFELRLGLKKLDVTEDEANPAIERARQSGIPETLNDSRTAPHGRSPAGPHVNTMTSRGTRS